MNRFYFLFCVLMLSACGGSRLRAPQSFVVVPESVRGGYHERLITADGLVVGARHFDSPENSTPQFWVTAIRDRIDEAGGYTLASEETIRDRGGRSGTLLKFTRQYSERSFNYWIAVFVHDRTVHVVEAGGPTEQFTGHEADILNAFRSFDAG